MDVAVDKLLVTELSNGVFDHIALDTDEVTDLINAVAVQEVYLSHFCLILNRKCELIPVKGKDNRGGEYKKVLQVINLQQRTY